MLALVADAAPYVHDEGTAYAIGVGLVTLAAAGLAVSVAQTRPSRIWRVAWRLMAGLCLLLAVDEALPLAEWITEATGVRWWKFYALPVAVGFGGSLLAGLLLSRELSWHRRSLRLLALGELGWVSAYVVRLVVFVNDHSILDSGAVRQTGLVLEAALKLAGSALLVLALADVRTSLGHSQRLRAA